MHLPLTFSRVSTFHRPAPGVSSLIASSRTPSPNAPTSRYLSKSNTGRSCSTQPLPPSPWTRTSSSEERLVEKGGRHASSGPRDGAKPWASICKSSISSFIPFLFLVRVAYFYPHGINYLIYRLQSFAIFVLGRPHTNTSPLPAPSAALSVRPSPHIGS